MEELVPVGAYFKNLRHHDYSYRTILEREGMINYNCFP